MLPQSGPTGNATRRRASGRIAEEEDLLHKKSHPGKGVLFWRTAFMDLKRVRHEIPSVVHELA
jgi:hypothetical protein